MLTPQILVILLAFLRQTQQVYHGQGGPGELGEFGESGGLEEEKPGQGGWLDRVVLYYKNKFYEDIERTLPDIEIKAEIQTIPPEEAADDKHDAVWDDESVLRLAALLRRSSSPPLRRLMEKIDEEIDLPTRRRYMPLRRRPSRKNARRGQRGRPRHDRRGGIDVTFSVPPVPDQELWAIDVGKSHLFFPKIHKEVDQYYDHDDAEYEFVENWKPGHESVGHIDLNKRIYIMNPVESRLPGRYIKIGLLKTILKERAIISRMLPANDQTKTWPPITTDTSSPETSSSDSSNTATTEPESNTTSIDENTTASDNSTDIPDSSSSSDSSTNSDSSDSISSSSSDSSDSSDPISSVSDSSNSDSSSSDSDSSTTAGEDESSTPGAFEPAK